MIGRYVTTWNTGQTNQETRHIYFEIFLNFEFRVTLSKSEYILPPLPVTTSISLFINGNSTEGTSRS
jgi:hypothetical protein